MPFAPPWPLIVGPDGSRVACTKATGNVPPCGSVTVARMVPGVPCAMIRAPDAAAIVRAIGNKPVIARRDIRPRVDLKRLNVTYTAHPDGNRDDQAPCSRLPEEVSAVSGDGGIRPPRHVRAGARPVPRAPRAHPVPGRGA